MKLEKYSIQFGNSSSTMTLDADHQPGKEPKDVAVGFHWKDFGRGGLYLNGPYEGTDKQDAMLLEKFGEANIFKNRLALRNAQALLQQMASGIGLT
jgi:hypothetical protein